MGKIGSLGDVNFSVSDSTVKTFQSMKLDAKTVYATHTRHNLKPLLEFQYNDTYKLTFDMYLSAFLGVNPGRLMNKIDEMRENGEVVRLIIGGEKYGGKWVITSTSKDYKYFNNKGDLLIAKITVSLEEYASR